MQDDQTFFRGFLNYVLCTCYEIRIRNGFSPPSWMTLQDFRDLREMKKWFGAKDWMREQLAWFFSASRHALIWLRLSSLPFLVPASMYLVRSPRAHNGHQMWKAACDLPPLITVGFPIEHYYRIDGGGLLKEAKWVFHHDLCGPKLKAINLSARQKTPDKKFTYVHLAKIHWSNALLISEPINNG